MGPDNSLFGGAQDYWILFRRFTLLYSRKACFQANAALFNKVKCILPDKVSSANFVAFVGYPKAKRLSASRDFAPDPRL